jgi:cytoskeletal protein RodZ
MTPDPHVRRGAHRTKRAPSAALLPSLLAILAVTSLITALYVWRGEDSKQPPAAASSGSSGSSSHSPTSTPSTSPTSTPTKTVKATEPVSKTSSPSTTKPKATTAEQLRASVALVVLNETTRSGLAATVATRLRSKGWTVAGVGNFRGEVPATTVYYPQGHEQAALAVAKSLPTPARTRPRFGNLSPTRLTVVVASNYPS